MEKQNVWFLIPTSRHPMYAARRAMQQQRTTMTLLRTLGRVLFILGHGDSDSDSDDDDNSDIRQEEQLSVNVDEAWETLPEKMVHAFQYAYQHGAHYVVKIDDDTLVTDDTLFKQQLQEMIEAGHDYGGPILHRIPKRGQQSAYHVKRMRKPLADIDKARAFIPHVTFVPGGCYFVSRRLLQSMVEDAFSQHRALLYEDIATALAAQTLRIAPVLLFKDCIRASTANAKIGDASTLARFSAAKGPKR